MIRLSKSKIFFLCCLVFIVGIAIASFLPDSFFRNPFLLFLGAVVCSVLLVLVWSSHSRPHPNPLLKTRRGDLIPLAPFLKGGFCVLLFLGLAFWRFGVVSEKEGGNKIENYNGGKAEFIGVIIKEPDIRENKIKYEVDAESVDGKEVSGRVLVNAGLYPEFDYGDRVEIACKLQAPEKIEDFAYDRYLARYGIYSLCYFPKMEFMSAGEGNLFFAKIFSFKNIVREKIDRGLPEPESGLAKGFILGDKKSIDDELNDKFARIGISHIVAISGANVSILINLIMLFAVGVGLSRKHSFYFSSSLLFIYIILVGFPASAMRAGLMGFLILWAIYLGRLSKSANALVLAAAVMLFVNPKILRDDIGFQLSFLAMLSIVYLYPILDEMLEKIKMTNKFSLRDIMAMTLAAQVLTLPIMINNFQQMSSVFLLSNFFVLWTLPILMAALSISIILSFILSHPIIFLFSQAILKFIVLIAEFFSGIPHASIPIKPLPWLVWVFYYFILAYFILRYKKRRPLC